MGFLIWGRHFFGWSLWNAMIIGEMGGEKGKDGGER